MTQEKKNFSQQFARVLFSLVIFFSVNAKTTILFGRNGGPVTNGLMNMCTTTLAGNNATSGCLFTTSTTSSPTLLIDLNLDLDHANNPEVLAQALAEVDLGGGPTLSALAAVLGVSVDELMVELKNRYP